jgi:glycosyltransferase involved in cell wall biosynthesis
MTDLSIIICTRNPRHDFLSRVLDALQKQTLGMEHWELLLIDNASDRKLADEWDLSWHPRARHIREDTPGLTPARLRGIRESRGDLLVFVDDDNVLSEDFLCQALAAMTRHPYLGVLGAGVLEPEFEVAPPAELLPKLYMYAIRSVPKPIWSSNPTDYSCMPMGAGLCVTRAVADKYLQLIARLNVTELVDRREQHLFSGGDDLFSWAASWAGQGFGIFPAMRVRHLMLEKRLNQSYFRRLSKDHTFSHGVLRFLLTGAVPRRITMYECFRLFLHWVRNGKFSTQCQWADLQGAEGAGRFIVEHRLQPIAGSQMGSFDGSFMTSSAGSNVGNSNLRPIVE